MLTVIDSSVWIDLFAGREHAEVVEAREVLTSPAHRVCVLDVILTEVLQGARSEAEAERLDGYFSPLPFFVTGGQEEARTAAARYRRLRREGRTVRKTIDVLIASWCLDHGAALLHRDRDFAPFTEVFGLRTP